MAPETLRAWRVARSLSRADAADTLGVNARTYEALEQGRFPTSALWGPLSRLIALMPPPQLPGRP